MNIYVLFLISILNGLGYGIVAPLFYTVAEKKKLNEIIIGLIISTYSVSNLIITPFAYKIFHLMGKKRCLQMSLIVEGISCLIFGLLPVIQNVYIFTTLSFIFRSFHGLSAALTNILIYSFGLSNVEESEFISVVGLLELGFILGHAFAPLYDSITYHFGGYILSYSIVFVLCMILPIVVNNYETVNSIEENKKGFFSYFLNLDVFLISNYLGIGFLSVTYLYPILSIFLEKTYNLNVEQTSIFFTVQMVAYFICFRLLISFQEKVFFGFYVILGFITGVYAQIFIGIHSLYRSYWSIVTGVCLQGVSLSLLYVPTIPYLIKTIEKINPEAERDQNIDIANSIFNFCIYLADILGPIIGGFLTSYIGFENTSYAIIFLKFSFLIISIFHFKQYLISKFKVFFRMEDATKEENIIETGEKELEEKELLM